MSDPVTVTVPKGLYFGTSQEEADGYAMNAACTEAESLLVCQDLPPILDCEPPQTWPSEAGGTPYSNPGDSVAGLTDIYGNGLPGLVGGPQLSYSFPYNADPDPFSGTMELSGFSFPVEAGDFDMTLEFAIQGGPNYAYEANILFYSETDQGFSFGWGAFTVTTGGLRAKYDCDIITNGEGASNIPFDPALPTGGLINDLMFHEYRLVRTGTIFEIFLDSVSYGTWDSESNVFGKIGFTLKRRTWDSDNVSPPDFRIRNITIN